jgi:hypothetical protein
MEIIDRKEAKKAGLKKYFTGEPCKNGHITERYTSGGTCLGCCEDLKDIDDIPISRICEFLEYDESTGLLMWKPRENDLAFNNKFAGNTAGNEISPTNSRTSYIRVRVENKLYLAHRVIWAMRYGEWPEGTIDHIDGDGTNNRIDNLRDVSGKDNSRNCRLSRNNTSGVNGVWKQADRYVAEIMVNRKKLSLGSFDTLEEAAAARKAADRIYGFYETHGDSK